MLMREKGILRSLLRALAPSLAASFSALYIFWLLPMKILSQEYTLTSLFIANNKFIYASFLLFTACFIILLLLDCFWKLGYTIALWSGLLVLMLTFLYPYILPYSYGGFIDNSSLTPKFSLLGFSKLYYLLDFTLITISALAAGLFIKYKKSTQVFSLMIIFYLAEGIVAFNGAIRIDPKAQKLQKNPFIFSKNHPNVLVFVLDSLPGPIMLDYIENFLPENGRFWEKDFTFYPNVLSLSTSGTAISVPSMLGGYKYSPQYLFSQASDVKKGRTKGTTEKFSYQTLFSERALMDFTSNLSPYANVFYIEKGIFDDPNGIQNDNAQINYASSSIFSVPLYTRIPYIARKLIVHEYDWRFSWTHRWFGFFSVAEYRSAYTEKGAVYILHGQGVHPKNISKKYPKGEFGSGAETNMRDILLHSLSYTSSNMISIINKIKDLGIYDSTKIIMTSDHGYASSTDALKEYVKAISPFPSIIRYWDYPDLTSQHLVSFLMIKNTNVSNRQLKVDSRFLSLGDLPSILSSTFSRDIFSEPDYTEKHPPLRTFNVLIANTAALEDLTGSPSKKGAAKRFYDQFISNNQWPYLEVKGITDGNYSLKYWPAEHIAELPAVETNDRAPH